MTPHRILRTAGLALVCALLLGASTAPTLDRLFPREAEILAEAPGLMRLPLPPAVLARTRPDLSDLRVFDAQGREVPYLVDSRRGTGAAVEATETFTSRVLSLERSVEERDPGPSIHREHYRIIAPPESPEQGAWSLFFEIPAPRFVRTLTVRVASAEPGGAPLVEDRAVFRLDAETQRLHVELPPFRADALEVDIAGEEGSFLEPRFRFESRRIFAPLGESTVPLELLSQERRDATTVLELARPSGVVPGRLRIATATGSFQRTIRVFDEQPGRAERLVGKGQVFRLNARRDIHELEVEIRSVSGTVLRVEIDDGDAPSLEAIEVAGVMHQPVLLFDLPEPPAAAAGASGTPRVLGTLRFGGGRAHRPRYQLQSLLLGARETLRGTDAEAALRLYDPAELGLARLGPVRMNPTFDSSPALAFAMRPGAQIDERTYSHRRSIQIAPSAEGLSQLVLEPEDVARSEANLADVRVVDAEGHQWPYLRQRSAVRRALALEVASSESRRRITTTELSLPIAPLQADRLTLQMGAPYFDRAYRLFALDEDGRRQRLASGRIVKDGRRPRPTRIAFSARMIHGLVLEVEDGDDVPLEIRAAEVRTHLPRLFLVAPAGSFTLLVGNPQARDPLYELERVRGVVLAVSSSPALESGPLEANPRYSVAARLGGEDGPSGLLQTMLVWSALLVAVVVLALLTLRVLRNPPPPTTPGENEGT